MQTSLDCCEKRPHSPGYALTKIWVLNFGLFPSMDPQLGCLRHSREVIRDKINRSTTLVQSPPPTHSIQHQIILILILCRQQVINYLWMLTVYGNHKIISFYHIKIWVYIFLKNHRTILTTRG